MAQASKLTAAEAGEAAEGICGARRPAGLSHGLSRSPETSATTAAAITVARKPISGISKNPAISAPHAEPARFQKYSEPVTSAKEPSPRLASAGKAPPMRTVGGSSTNAAQPEESRAKRNGVAR